MLRACALDYGSSWYDNLPYAEFSYNNSYQASIEMAPFEALYGKKRTTPLLWSGLGERNLFGPDIIQEAQEKVRLIKDRLNTAQSRQKSYAHKIVQRIREISVIVLIVLGFLTKASDTHPTPIILFALEFFSKSSMHVRVVFVFKFYFCLAHLVVL